MPRFKALIWMLSLATLSATAFGQTANQARPGTLNYIEGQASIEGRAVTPNSVGNTVLESGQYLSTANGKAEILLTPGVFLRLGNDSTVQMVSPNLTKTEVRLERGHANVEADQLYKQNIILIDLKNGQTQLLQNGLYTFDADSSTVRVFDGKAAAFRGENLQADIKPIDIKGGRELALTGEAVKPQHFDKNKSEDDLYHWSSLRSEYLGEANVGLAEEYAGVSGFYPGWYWAGGPYGYTWLPGDGLFWNPYGYGFYSPYYLYGGGFIYGRFGRGGYPYRGGRAVGGNFRGGNFHGGAEGFRGGGGGFHGGGGGGFHGGGGGGGHR
jgi:FecR protein